MLQWRSSRHLALILNALAAIAVCLGLFGLASTSKADEVARTIVVATGEYPPFAASDFRHHGLIPRIVTEAFKVTNVEVVYEFYPWARAYELSKDGRVDATAYWYSSEDRREHHYYSDPIMQDTLAWFHLRSTDFDWETLEDMADYRIGAVNGYTYTPEFYELIENGTLKVQFVPKEMLNYRKLLAGRIDVFPEVIDMGLYTLHTEYPEDTAALITLHPKPFTRRSTHLLAPKVRPGSRELIARFNKGLKHLRDEGLLEEYLLESRQGLYRPSG